jgi:hypothetical protein
MPALYHAEALEPAATALAHALWVLLASVQQTSPLAGAQLAEVLSVLSAEVLGRACAARRLTPPLTCGDVVLLSDWCLETQRRALAVTRALLAEEDDDA